MKNAPAALTLKMHWVDRHGVPRDHLCRLTCPQHTQHMPAGFHKLLLQNDGAHAMQTLHSRKGGGLGNACSL